jgi:colanic acid biosynthesis protein WcaH
MKILNKSIFKTVIDSAPLISIDIILKKDDKLLLGRRVNKPAKNYFFSPGGRIHKNETIKNALMRIAKKELNINLLNQPKFIGTYEHFYPDSIFKDISTHYINLAYEYHINEPLNLPNEEHDEYKWFSINELMSDNKVHKYVKNYFRSQI